LTILSAQNLYPPLARFCHFSDSKCTSAVDSEFVSNLRRFDDILTHSRRLLPEFQSHCQVESASDLVFPDDAVFRCRGEKELREIEREAADAQRIKDAQER
jgi:hypothetical protein